MMKHTAMKLIHALCGMAAMLVLVASIASVPALAASNGIYLATATPHYKHPVTGVIEDSGGAGSAVLGQSMTESATYKQALVEVDPQGNTYVTIRLQLMDNIKDPQFQVDGKAVTATLMQENYGSLSAENTADYRMKVNSENSVIRCNMFVIAMGREVIFYITVSNLQTGSGDFITSVKVETPSISTPETKKPQETSKPQATSKPKDTSKPQATYKPQTTSNLQETSKPQTYSQSTSPSETDESTPPVSVQSETTQSETPTSESTKPTTLKPESEIKSESSDVPGIQEFDKAGNKVSNESESKDPEKNGSPMVWWIVGSIVVLAAAGGCVWYFVSYRKKK